MTTELITYLLSWAVFYTGYAMPANLPVIEFVPHNRIVYSVCLGIDTTEKPCTVRAMYDDQTSGIIYLNKKFFNGSTTADMESSVVHEIVHYLQDVSGEWATMHDQANRDIICYERTRREREAYMTQYKYLEAVYNIKSFIRRTFDRCENERQR